MSLGHVSEVAVEKLLLAFLDLTRAKPAPSYYGGDLPDA